MPGLLRLLDGDQSEPRYVGAEYRNPKHARLIAERLADPSKSPAEFVWLEPGTPYVDNMNKPQHVSFRRKPREDARDREKFMAELNNWQRLQRKEETADTAPETLAELAPTQTGSRRRKKR